MRNRTPSLNTLDAVAMTVGAMVGAGIFSVLALTVRTASYHAAWSWFLVVLFSLPMALTFSDLTGVLSASGGPYIYVRQKRGYRLGLWTAWLLLWSSVGAADALFVALIGMLRETGISHPTLWGTLLLVVLAAVTTVGVHVGARVQRVLTAITVALLLVCIVVGLAHAHLHGGTLLPGTERPVSESQGSGWRGVLQAAFYAFWTYSGWEAVAVPSQAYQSARSLGRGILLGSLLVGGLYILVAWAAVLSEPAGVLASSMNPLALVAALWGEPARQLVSAGAVVVVVGSLLSWLIASAGLLQALIRDRLLPAPALIRRHEGEYHPVLPWIFVCLFLILLPIPMFSTVVAASSLTALIAYAVIFWTVSREPQADWPGLFKSTWRRRWTARLALGMALVLMLVSGTGNLWPTLVIAATGWLVLRLRSKHRGS